MGFRLYRRVRIAPGIRLNFGTRGVSASFGHRGAWYTVGPHGRRTATLGFPGTGLRYTQTISGARRPLPKPAPDAPGNALYGIVVIVGLIVLVVGLAHQIASS